MKSTTGHLKFSYILILIFTNLRRRFVKIEM